MDSTLQLLALSGSLRQKSYNSAALKALKVLAPESVEVIIGDISGLPLFNQDLESEHIAAVGQLKLALAQTSGLIIASPEYAHGISGPMKNALDWLVSGVEFPSTPIMLINTSPRASHAMLSLREVLHTMSGNIIEDASLSIPLLGSELDQAGILCDSEMIVNMKKALGSFIAAIQKKEPSGGS